MPETPDQSLEAAIAALWLDARPRAGARVDVVDAAVAALAAGTLDASAAERAAGEAHKLAGSLGTFGMPDATAHARTLERAFAAGPAPADAPALAAAVSGLRAAIAGGRGGAG